MNRTEKDGGRSSMVHVGRKWRRFFLEAMWVRGKVGASDAKVNAPNDHWFLDNTTSPVKFADFLKETAGQTSKKSIWVLEEAPN